MLIFWDIDGTLMYCGSDGTKALNETFFDLYKIKDAFSGEGIGGTMDGAIIEKIMNTYDISVNELSKIKYTFTEKLKDILENDTNKKVLPGIREIIESIEQEGHINSLLTSNMRTGAYAKLESVGLNGHFTGGGFGDEANEKVDMAKSALKEIEEQTELTFENGKIILIGDSVYDIKTAKKLGYKIITVATGWTDKETLAKEDPDILLDSLEDVRAVMEVIRKIDQGV